VGGSRIYVKQTGLTLNGKIAKRAEVTSRNREAFLTSFGMTNFFVRRHGLMLVGNGEPHINGGEHRKDVRLNDGNEDMKADKHDRNQDRENGKGSSE